MTNIILCGTPDDRSVTDTLISTLAYYGGVRYSGPDCILERGVSAKYFLYEYTEIPKLELQNGILLFKNNIRQTKKAEIPAGFICVMETKNLRAAALLKNQEAAVITCGTGGKDTLSIAGLQSSGAALSLQRSIRTVDGTILEPHDFTVGFSEKRSPHQLLLVCSSLLAAGIDSSSGYLI